LKCVAVSARSPQEFNSTMTELPDLKLARHCFSRAKVDVETWLALVERGQLATIAPFGQMFIYQLKKQARLTDKAFAVDELYRLYYRRADGKGDPPVPGDDLCGTV
jgi:hypothetical protein